MLELLLLRHGVAQERCLELPEDERALTELGRVRTRAVGQRLVALELLCEGLFCSPLVRARQTAEIVVEAGLLVPRAAWQIEAALAPGADPWPLILGLQQQVRQGRWGLVGHEPDLGDLVARLIGAPAGTIPLKKAGIALVQLAPGAAQLRLLMAPKQILAS